MRVQVGGNALMRQAFDSAGLPRGLCIKVPPTTPEYFGSTPLIFFMYLSVEYP